MTRLVLGVLLWLGLMLCFPSRLLSQSLPTDSLRSRGDTLRRVRSDRFYDALMNRFNKPGLKGMVVKSIISPVKRPGTAEYKLVKERKYYELYQGLKIREISVIRSNVFNEADSLTGIRRFLRNWHWLSTERTIRRYLLIKKGKEIDPELMVKNEQLLRALPFLQDAYIVLQKIGDKEADVFIYTHDNLSFSPAFNSEGIRKYYISVAENNLKGTGNKLEVGTYLSAGNPLYRGYKGEYKAYNLYGTFFDLDLLALKNYTYSAYLASLDKSFISSSDYAGGLTYELKRYNQYQRISDTTVVIGENTMDIWGGKSFKISPLLGNIYMSARWVNRRFPLRYDVNAAFNPNYHNRSQLFLTTGLYKENFYRGNLIYGFGRSEDIPYGFRIEFTGGLSNEEFTRRMYLGGKAQWAHITHFGFLSEALDIGSYYNKENNRYEQSVFSSTTDLFSYLIPIGKWGLRNFLSARYMYGFNRLPGEDEKLMFSSDNIPRAIRVSSVSQIKGYRRLVTSLESVAFSPMYVYGFRFALYGFCDYAWLGYDRRIFRNDSYSTVGFGVRVKNERLIFQTIQLRFGIALKKPPGGEMDWLNISETQRMKSSRLTPGRPGQAEYR